MFRGRLSASIMKVAVFKESIPGENRVALVPGNLKQLAKVGVEVWVQRGAGEAAGYSDQQYIDAGARLVEQPAELADAAVVVQVCWPAGSDPDPGLYSSGTCWIGMCDPLGKPADIARLAEAGVTQFALEMIPRITRAQSMDVLSSMATIAGYRAVLLAASELPRMFPLMMTAAGTLAAARVFVIGAGVAGLQAIATARRLGAIVQAYDLRPACREQVESLGAGFVELELDSEDAEDKGGYAKEMDEEFYRRQRELMAEVVAQSDVVITTAAIPGRDSPLLVTAEAVAGMRPGSVIVDLAAERGGNCALTQADQRVLDNGVVILGPTNLPADVPYHASQMFSGNVTRLLIELIEDESLKIDLDDEIVQSTLVAHDGAVCHPRIRELLGLDPLNSTAVDNDADSVDDQQGESQTQDDSHPKELPDDQATS
jgi:NAD(P) transhydrogenase subunit alpha